MYLIANGSISVYVNSQGKMQEKDRLSENVRPPPAHYHTAYKQVEAFGHIKCMHCRGGEASGNPDASPLPQSVSLQSGRGEATAHA